MKLAISGKGGVGKTTLAALLAQVYAERGQAVLAVDADPSPCLADSLGFPADVCADLRPIAEMQQLIEERTGSKKGAGGFFSLTPHVDDLPERFSVEHRGVKFLAMGSVLTGGSGCMCAENSLLRALLSHLLLGDDDVLIVDMHAGVEHLGRATVDSVDAMVIVVEPTRRSLAAAAQIEKLAGHIGLDRVWLVGNKIRNEGDARFIESVNFGASVLGHLPADPAVEEAERLGLAAYDHAPPVKAAAEELAERLARISRQSAS